jgi:hypothetical protein
MNLFIDHFFQLGVSKYFTPLEDDEIPYDKTIKLLETIKVEKSVSQKVDVLSKVRTQIMMDIRNYRLQRRKFEKGDKYSKEHEKEDEGKVPNSITFLRMATWC